MTDTKVLNQLSILMIRFGLKSKYAMLKTAEDNHITLMPAMTLCLLDPGQVVPMKAIAQFMSCDPSNITSIIDQLVQEGLVERKESPLDRRIKTISITKKGLKLRDKFLEITAATRLPDLHSLSAAEAEQLITLLEKATNTSTAQSIRAEVGV
jgi:DNA-binding MarR family transcriptional regulator